MQTTDGTAHDLCGVQCGELVDRTPSMQLNAAGHAASQVLKERRDAIAQRVASLYSEAHPLFAPRWKGDPLSIRRRRERSSSTGWAAITKRAIPSSRTGKPTSNPSP